MYNNIRNEITDYLLELFDSVWSSTLFRMLGLWLVDRLGRFILGGVSTVSKGDGVVPDLGVAWASCSDLDLAISTTGKVTGSLGALSSSKNLMKALAMFCSKGELTELP